MSDIELDDLSTTRQTASVEEVKQSVDTSTLARDSETVFYWAWAASTLLLATAVPLLLFPRFLLFLAEGGEERRIALTPLESFLSLHIGILLVAVGLALILNVPSSVPAADPQQATSGHPLLGPLTGACTLIAFISYNTRSVGALGLLLSLGSTIISIWGVWVMLFESTSSISKKTGADKHTSRFLFGNKAAASAQKKQWKKRQAESKTR